MWSMGVQVEVLNMTDSSNKSMVPSVDFLNRSDFVLDDASPCTCIQTAAALGSLTLPNWSLQQLDVQKKQICLVRVQA